MIKTYGTVGQQRAPKKMPRLVPASSASFRILVFPDNIPYSSVTNELPNPISIEFSSSAARWLAALIDPTTNNAPIATGSSSVTKSMQKAIIVENRFLFFFFGCDEIVGLSNQLFALESIGVAGGTTKWASHLGHATSFPIC
jgi:hypothetical protein